MHTSLTYIGGRRTALVSTTVATALLLSAMSPGTAEARTSYTYRDSGRAAETSWTQVDGTDMGTAFGNVHIGYLDVRETRKGVGEVWGEIADFDCEPGRLPDHGGHHGFEDDEWEEPDDGCEHVGFRWIEGSNLAFDVDKKLTNATLRGTMTVYGGGHGEEVSEVGYPMANITWTGEGATFSSRFNETYSDGYWTYSYRGRYTSRSASMGGQLGPMGFDPDLSSGSIREYRVSERGRTR